MPVRTVRTPRLDSLLGEVGLRLPLFDGLPSDTVRDLSALGFGRGFLTASLRARLRKAGFPDLGHLARSSPDMIAGVRKFGPIRVALVRAFILDEVARRLPEGRPRYAPDAVGQRRLDRLRTLPIDRLPLSAGAIAALGLAGCSCAEIAGRSRAELLHAGSVLPADVDRIVTALARLLGEEGATVPAPEDAREPEPETREARRAALLAEQDRDWEAAAPDRIRRGGGTPRPD